MITLQQLIENEMESVLYHTPTQAEKNSLSEFLAAKQLKWLADVELAISDWRNACTKECAWCGDRYLESEMIQTAGNEWFCCEQCQKDYKEEHPVAE